MKRFFCTLLCVCFLLLHIGDFAYAKEEIRSIRFGIALADGFLMQAADGSYDGYMVTYLQELSQYTSWDYEIVTANNQEELLSLLQDGELDVVMGVQAKDAYNDAYVFTDQYIGNSYTTLAVSVQDITHVPNDYHAYDGMTIGYVEGDERSYQALHAFADAYAFSFTEVAYPSYERLREDVTKQNIDAMVAADITAQNDLRINNRFSSKQLGIVVHKELRDVLEDLNFALESIHEINMNYDMQVYDAFFPKSQNPSLILSEEEKAFVAELPALRVVSGLNTVPLDYFEAGRYQGISAGMLKRISELTGIRFTYTRAESFADAYDRLGAGEADVITDLYHHSLTSMPKDMIYLSPLSSMQMMVLQNRSVKEKTLSDAVMALPNGYHRIDDIQPKETILYDSLEDCILAVHHGNADFVYGSAYAIDYYVRKHGITNVDIAPITNTSRALMLGTSKQVDPRLVSILNKAITCISQEERQQIFLRTMFEANHEITLPAFLRMHFAKVLIAVILLACFICIRVLSSIKKKRKEEMKQIQRYQMLAEISGDFIFEYDFLKDQLMISSKDAERLGVPAVIDNYLSSVKNQEFFYSMEDMYMLSEEELQDPSIRYVQRDLAWTSIDGSSYQLHVLLMIERDQQQRPILCIGRIQKEAV